jgi:hypothetical protein
VEVAGEVVGERCGDEVKPVAATEAWRAAGAGFPWQAPHGRCNGHCGWSHGRAGWWLHLRTAARHEGEAPVLVAVAGRGGAG